MVVLVDLARDGKLRREAYKSWEAAHLPEPLALHPSSIDFSLRSPAVRVVLSWPFSLDFASIFTP